MLIKGAGSVVRQEGNPSQKLGGVEHKREGGWMEGMKLRGRFWFEVE